jgi:PAS domain S-box-containing protein
MAQPANRLMVELFIAGGVLSAAARARAHRGVRRSGAGPASRRRVKRHLEAFAAASTAEFEALLYEAPVGFALLDREGRFTWINEHLADMHGVPVEAHYGRTIGEIIPSVAIRVAPVIERVLAGEAVRDVEVTGETPKRPGELRWWLLSTFPVRGASGEVISVAAVVVEITERKRAEEALREGEAKFRAVFDCAVVPLVIWRLDGRIADANDAYLDLFGFTREEIRSGEARWTEITPREYQPDEVLLAELASTGRIKPREIECVSREGARIPVLVAGSTLPGHADLGVSFVMDLSDRQRIERERELLLESERAARGDAERASQSKDEFVAMLSHELRSPLNTVLGWTQLLWRPGRTPEQLDKGLAAIDRGARVLAQLISDLLDVSRIVSGKLRLEAAPIDLPAVIQAALDGVRASARAKGIALHTAIAPAPGVVGDPARLQQVVWNLASNAVKFTPAGGRVDVTLTAGRGAATITVADTGNGIAPEFLPHIFERFRQADSSLGRRHGGLGLGLSIVKHLVELHGGRVRAESAGLGRGARFIVELPVAAQRGERIGPWLSPAVTPPEASCLSGTKVLVVDDEQDARELVRRILEEFDADVVIAASAPEALEVLGRERPEVLVCDIGMPGMDGYAMIREIRAGIVPGMETVPAVALTAFARGEDRRRALEAGFQAHVAKPVEAPTLVSAAARLARQGDGREPRAGQD